MQNETRDGNCGAKSYRTPNLGKKIKVLTGNLLAPGKEQRKKGKPKVRQEIRLRAKE
jgi:hypothetical protein